jgi:hypothetical protein
MVNRAEGTNARFHLARLELCVLANLSVNFLVLHNNL